ncbi:MAG: SMC-Scp complex subunit ScpB [Chitinophagaceae bacterium]|nr:SMC-Scp complex subunit ScpB [Chitinophagaceae bacterium]
MELSTIIPHIEALIFASDKPLTTPDIVELINNAFGFMEHRISIEQVDAAVEGIQEKYNAEFYPFEVRESGGGWQFLTKKEFHKTVGQLNGDKFLKRLSNAALETLAIIAYKQPITKGEVEAIRGVNSDYSIQKLLEKELIVISGRNENLPGKPLVYSTSKAFMDYFGINNTNDLPRIKEVLAEQLIEATVVNSALNAHEDFAFKEAQVDDRPKAQRELFVTEEAQENTAYRNEINDGVHTLDAAIEEGASVEKEESLAIETDHQKPTHMTTHEEDTFDGNPSPPKSKTVIKENFVGDTDATLESETQQTAEQDMALNSRESFAKNPSPPKADSTIGNA